MESFMDSVFSIRAMGGKKHRLGTRMIVAYQICHKEPSDESSLEYQMKLSIPMEDIMLAPGVGSIRRIPLDELARQCLT